MTTRPMTGYVLDMNIVTAYLKRHLVVRQRLRDAEVAGQSVGLSAVSYPPVRDRLRQIHDGSARLLLHA